MDKPNRREFLGHVGTLLAAASGTQNGLDKIGALIEHSPTREDTYHDLGTFLNCIEKLLTPGETLHQLPKEEQIKKTEEFAKLAKETALSEEALAQRSPSTLAEMGKNFISMLDGIINDVMQSMGETEIALCDIPRDMKEKAGILWPESNHKFDDSAYVDAEHKKIEHALSLVEKNLTPEQRLAKWQSRFEYLLRTGTPPQMDPPQPVEIQKNDTSPETEKTALTETKTTPFVSADFRNYIEAELASQGGRKAPKTISSDDKLWQGRMTDRDTNAIQK